MVQDATQAHEDQGLREEGSVLSRLHVDIELGPQGIGHLFSSTDGPSSQQDVAVSFPHWVFTFYFKGIFLSLKKGIEVNTTMVYLFLVLFSSVGRRCPAAGRAN